MLPGGLVVHMAMTFLTTALLKLCVSGVKLRLSDISFLHYWFSKISFLYWLNMEPFFFGMVGLYGTATQITPAYIQVLASFGYKRDLSMLCSCKRAYGYNGTYDIRFVKTHTRRAETLKQMSSEPWCPIKKVLFHSTYNERQLYMLATQITLYWQGHGSMNVLVV